MAIERFSNVPLFEGLTSEEIAKILSLADDITAHPADIIVEEGHYSEGFMLISAGVFAVVKKDGDEHKELARLERNTHFGEMSLLTDEPYSASVICLEEGRLKRITARKFQELLDSGDPVAVKLVLNMSRLMARRLRRAENRLE